MTVNMVRRKHADWGTTQTIIILVMWSSDEQRSIQKKKKGGKQSGAIVWSLHINSSIHYVTGPDINQ